MNGIFAGQAAFHEERMVPASTRHWSFATETRVAMRSLEHPGVAKCSAHSTIMTVFRVPRGTSISAPRSCLHVSTIRCHAANDVLPSLTPPPLTPSRSRPRIRSYSPKRAKSASKSRCCKTHTAPQQRPSAPGTRATRARPTEERAIGYST